MSAVADRLAAACFSSCAVQLSHANLLCDLASQFVADDPARDALYVRQEIVQRFDLAFATAHRELSPGTLNQVVEIALGIL